MRSHKSISFTPVTPYRACERNIPGAAAAAPYPTTTTTAATTTITRLAEIYYDREVCRCRMCDLCRRNDVVSCALIEPGEGEIVVNENTYTEKVYACDNCMFNIRSISFKNCNLSNPRLAAPNLESLELESCILTGSLPYLKALKRLKIEECKITPDLSILLSKIDKLEELAFWGDRVELIDARRIEEIITRSYMFNLRLDEVEIDKYAALILIKAVATANRKSYLPGRYKIGCKNLLDESPSEIFTLSRFHCQYCLFGQVDGTQCLHCGLLNFYEYV